MTGQHDTHAQRIDAGATSAGDSAPGFAARLA
jgi:hypothetical protein